MFSKALEVARWPSWAPMQKAKVGFDKGDGHKLSQSPEALALDRQIYDALLVGIGGDAYCEESRAAGHL